MPSLEVGHELRHVLLPLQPRELAHAGLAARLASVQRPLPGIQQGALLLQLVHHGLLGARQFLLLGSQPALSQTQLVLSLLQRPLQRLQLLPDGVKRGAHLQRKLRRWRLLCACVRVSLAIGLEARTAGLGSDAAEATLDFWRNEAQKRCTNSVRREQEPLACPCGGGWAWAASAATRARCCHRWRCGDGVARSQRLHGQKRWWWWWWWRTGR